MIAAWGASEDELMQEYKEIRRVPGHVWTLTERIISRKCLKISQLRFCSIISIPRPRLVPPGDIGRYTR